jgi:hypothetical protein
MMAQNTVLEQINYCSLNIYIYNMYIISIFSLFAAYLGRLKCKHHFMVQSLSILLDQKSSTSNFL